MWYNSVEVIKMSNTTYNIRIDKRVREQADALYKNMGLSLSSAINLFLRQSVIQGKLPISEIIAEPAYADALLLDAAEIDAEIANGTAKVYVTPDELFAEWEREE
jgi:DNA-damage-inducible protein J